MKPLDLRDGEQSASLLELDPDLAVGLGPREVKRARDALVARVYEVEPGPWEIREPLRARGAFGLLVADGLLGLETRIGNRATLELVGRGDLLQPWVQLGAETTVPPTAGWHVIERGRLLLLDRQFATDAAEWPEVVAALMHRLVLRSRRLCYQLAVNSSPRAEERVLHALWALADRWGRVTEEGTVLEVHLTHHRVATIVCAKRPSVSTALGRLRDRGLIAYSRDRFVLLGDPPLEVQALKRQVAAL